MQVTCQYQNQATPKPAPRANVPCKKHVNRIVGAVSKNNQRASNNSTPNQEAGTTPQPSARRKRSPNHATNHINKRMARINGIPASVKGKILEHIAKSVFAIRPRIGYRSNSDCSDTNKSKQSPQKTTRSGK